MQEYISNAGYASLTASTAEEALDLLKKNNFAVVVTDIRLPGMGGLELTKIIKQDNGADVIVVTGYSDDYSYEEAINIGASDFVIKPVRLEELLLRLRRYRNSQSPTGLPNCIIHGHFIPSLNWRWIASTGTNTPFRFYCWILIILKNTTIAMGILKAIKCWYASARLSKTVCGQTTLPTVTGVKSLR